MIKQTERLVITFHTTTDAMAMEDICKENHVEGRIIPLPSSISAGCGLAWACPPCMEKEMTEFMKKQGLAWQEIRKCVI